jgi:hypothetical protein
MGVAGLEKRIDRWGELMHWHGGHDVREKQSEVKGTACDFGQDMGRGDALHGIGFLWLVPGKSALEGAACDV